MHNINTLATHFSKKTLLNDLPDVIQSKIKYIDPGVVSILDVVFNLLNKHSIHYEQEGISIGMILVDNVGPTATFKRVKTQVNEGKIFPKQFASLHVGAAINLCCTLFNLHGASFVITNPIDQVEQDIGTIIEQTLCSQSLTYMILVKSNKTVNGELSAHGWLYAKKPALGHYTQQYFDELRNGWNRTPRLSIQQRVEMQGINAYRLSAERFYTANGQSDDITGINTTRDFISFDEGKYEFAIKWYRHVNNHHDISRATIIYFAGVGTMFTLDKAYDVPLKTLAAYSGCDVVRVFPRLCPEFSRLDSAEDAYKSIKYLWEFAPTYRIDRTKFYVGGNSSGSHLAALAVHKSLRTNEFKVSAQIYIGLSSDLTRQKSQWSQYEAEDIMLQRDDVEYLIVNSLPPGTDRKSPDVSPLYDDFSYLPPTVLVCGEYDALRGDTERYAEKMRASGRDVHLRIVPGQVHNTLLLYRLIPDGPYPMKLAGIEFAKQFNPEHRYRPLE